MTCLIWVWCGWRYVRFQYNRAIIGDCQHSAGQYLWYTLSGYRPSQKDTPFSATVGEATVAQVSPQYIVWVWRTDTFQLSRRCLPSCRSSSAYLSYFYQRCYPGNDPLFSSRTASRHIERHLHAQSGYRLQTPAIRGEGMERYQVCTWQISQRPGARRIRGRVAMGSWRSCEEGRGNALCSPLTTGGSRWIVRDIYIFTKLPKY